MIEFVPKDDSMVRKLLATREMFDEYTIDGFRRAFGEYFTIADEAPRNGAGPVPDGSPGLRSHRDNPRGGAQPRLVATAPVSSSRPDLVHRGGLDGDADPPDLARSADPRRRRRAAHPDHRALGACWGIDRGALAAFVIGVALVVNDVRISGLLRSRRSSSSRASSTADARGGSAANRPSPLGPRHGARRRRSG